MNSNCSDHVGFHDRARGFTWGLLCVLPERYVGSDVQSPQKMCSGEQRRGSDIVVLLSNYDPGISCSGFHRRSHVDWCY